MAEAIPEERRTRRPNSQRHESRHARTLHEDPPVEPADPRERRPRRPREARAGTPRAPPKRPFAPRSSRDRDRAVRLSDEARGGRLLLPAARRLSLLRRRPSALLRALRLALLLFLRHGRQGTATFARGVPRRRRARLVRGSKRASVRAPAFRLSAQRPGGDSCMTSAARPPRADGAPGWPMGRSIV